MDDEKKPRAASGEADMDGEKKSRAALVEEQSSCLVITGDRRGRFWVCTIWSALADEEMMDTWVDELPATLQSFVHSRSIGRCLVFMHLLGHLCEELSKVYKVIVDSLDSIVKLGVSTFLARSAPFYIY
jgi:hypothetical protein